MDFKKNIVIAGPGNYPIVLDIFFETPAQNPVVIYAHGFNGFKDWGRFDLIAEKFAASGFVMVKFNFSQNGTSPGHPEEFTDLEAFGNNNYTKQLEDLNYVINWVCEPTNLFNDVLNSGKVYLLGHSMGGGICIIKAAEDERVRKLVTWAAVSECKTPWGNWPDDKMKAWKRLGVQYYTNSRTKQEMPLYYQLYEDYVQNKERLNIQTAITSLQIPVLICHGTEDSAVLVEKAMELKRWQPAAQLFTVQSDHVFGRKHPWTAAELPPATELVIGATINSLKGA